MSRFAALFIVCVLLNSCIDSNQPGKQDAATSVTKTDQSTLVVGPDRDESVLPPLAETPFSTRYGKAEIFGQALGAVGVFTGTSTSLQGSIDLQNRILSFSLPVKSLRTGIDQRDKDMYLLLNAEDHSHVHFTGTFESGFDATSPEKQPVTASGELLLNGQVQALNVDGFLQRDGDGLRLQAQWTIDIGDFGMKSPTRYRVSIDPEVEISIGGRLIPTLDPIVP